jgi:hypothetical protein
MNDRNLALKISKHPLIRRLLETKMATSSIVARLIVEELVSEGQEELKKILASIESADNAQDLEKIKDGADVSKTMGDEMGLSEEEYKKVLEKIQEKQKQSQQGSGQEKQNPLAGLGGYKDLNLSPDEDKAMIALFKVLKDLDLLRENLYKNMSELFGVEKTKKILSNIKNKRLKGILNSLLEREDIKKFLSDNIKEIEMIDPDELTAQEKELQQPTAKDPEDQDEPQTSPAGEDEQPDYFDLTPDQKEDLLAAAKEFINEFYEKQYLYEQGVLTKNMLSTILRIKSGEEKEKAAKKSGKKVDKLQEVEEDKVEASKGRLRSIQIAFRTFLREIKATNKAMKDFAEVAESGSIVASSKKKKFIQLLQRQQRDIVSLHNGLSMIMKNTLDEDMSTEVKWGNIEKHYDAASAALRGILGLSEEETSELRNAINLMDDAISNLRDLSGYFPNVNPFGRKDDDYDKFGEEYRSAVEEIKSFALQPILELTRTGEASKNVIEKAMEALKQFSTQISTIFGVKSQFKDAPPPAEKDAPAAEPDEKKEKIATRKPEAPTMASEEFEIGDLLAILEQHKDTYEKAKKLIETGKLNEDKRLANLKRVEDEFDNQADVLKNMFGVLDGLDSQSKKSIIKAAQAFVDLYDELQVTYDTLRGKEIGKPEIGKLSRFVTDAERDLEQMKKDLEYAGSDDPKRKQTMLSIKKKVLEILPVEAYKVLSGGTTEYYDTFIKFVLYIKSLLPKKTNEDLEDRIATDSSIDKEIIKQALDQIKGKSPQFFDDIEKMFKTELQQKRAKEVFKAIEGGFDALPEYEGDFFGDEFQNYKFKPGGTDAASELNNIFFNGKSTLTRAEAFILEKFKKHLATQTKIKSEAQIELRGINNDSINDFRSTLNEKQRETFKSALDKISKSPKVKNLSRWLLGKDLKILSRSGRIEMPSPQQVTQALEDADVDLASYEAPVVVKSIQQAAKEMSQQEDTEDMSSEEKINTLLNLTMTQKAFMELDFDTDEKEGIEKSITTIPDLANMFDPDGELEDEEPEKKYSYYNKTTFKEDDDTERNLSKKEVESRIDANPKQGHMIWDTEATSSDDKKGTWVSSIQHPDFKDYRTKPKEEPKKDDREPVEKGEFESRLKAAQTEMKEKFDGKTNMPVLDSILRVAVVSRSEEEAKKVLELAEKYINGEEIGTELSSFYNIDKEVLELKDFKNFKVDDTDSREIKVIVEIIEYLRVDLEELKPSEDLEEQIAKKIKPLIREMLRRNK